MIGTRMSLNWKSKSRGQALLEFALILTVLLMIIFFIIEASRIMWAWITVQNAARAGARYAITGDFDPDCATNGIDRYQYLCDETDPTKIKDANWRRPASIIKVTHDELRGLPLNETVAMTEDNGYEIFVWGVDDEELSDGISMYWRGSFMNEPRGPEPYGGKPNLPVAVRVIHYVPIITPFFRLIRSSIPVYGQTVLYNEPFDQLGGTGQSAGVPPPIPAMMTAGPTPTFTPTPTPGDTPTPTETSTPTDTPTAVPCPVRYTSSLVAGARFASVTGLWDAGGGAFHSVTFYDITDGDDPEDPGATNLVELGTAVMAPDTNDNQACPGVGDTAPPNQLSAPLQGGHFIKVVHSDGSSAVAQVQQGTDTPTPTHTSTPAPTSTLLPTNTPLPTATPRDPYVEVLETCVAPGSQRITVSVLNNWPNEDIVIFFDGTAVTTIYAYQHSGSKTIYITIEAVDGQTHTVRAETPGGVFDEDTFVSPCTGIVPTPVTATTTPTPKPPDLVIVGQPTLVSTTPIVEYEPVQFSVLITNTGDIDVNSQFFVDIYFDPTEVYSTYIPLDYSSGYLAIGSLAGGISRVITITVPEGFSGGLTEREVYGMVDSLRAVVETSEQNNVTGSELNVRVTPVASPTPSPTPENTDSVIGYVYSYNNGWAPQPRAEVWLKEVGAADPMVIGPVQADNNGDYTIAGVPIGVEFTAIACLRGTNYVYERPLVTAPSTGVGLFMQETVTGCPMQ